MGQSMSLGRSKQRSEKHQFLYTEVLLGSIISLGGENTTTEGIPLHSSQ